MPQPQATLALHNTLQLSDFQWRNLYLHRYGQCMYPPPVPERRLEPAVQQEAEASKAEEEVMKANDPAPQPGFGSFVAFSDGSSGEKRNSSDGDFFMTATLTESKVSSTGSGGAKGDTGSLHKAGEPFAAAWRLLMDDSVLRHFGREFHRGLTASGSGEVSLAPSGSTGGEEERLDESMHRLRIFFSLLVPPAKLAALRSACDESSSPEAPKKRGARHAPGGGGDVASALSGEQVGLLDVSLAPTWQEAFQRRRRNNLAPFETFLIKDLCFNYAQLASLFAMYEDSWRFTTLFFTHIDAERMAQLAQAHRTHGGSEGKKLSSSVRVVGSIAKASSLLMAASQSTKRKAERKAYIVGELDGLGASDHTATPPRPPGGGGQGLSRRRSVKDLNASALSSSQVSSSGEAAAPATFSEGRQQHAALGTMAITMTLPQIEQRMADVQLIFERHSRAAMDVALQLLRFSLDRLLRPPSAAGLSASSFAAPTPAHSLVMVPVTENTFQRSFDVLQWFVDNAVGITSSRRAGGPAIAVEQPTQPQPQPVTPATSTPRGESSLRSPSTKGNPRGQQQGAAAAAPAHPLEAATAAASEAMTRYELWYHHQLRVEQQLEQAIEAADTRDEKELKAKQLEVLRLHFRNMAAAERPLENADVAEGLVFATPMLMCGSYMRLHGAAWFRPLLLQMCALLQDADCLLYVTDRDLYVSEDEAGEHYGVVAAAATAAAGSSAFSCMPPSQKGAGKTQQQAKSAAQRKKGSRPPVLAESVYHRGGGKEAAPPKKPQRGEATAAEVDLGDVRTVESVALSDGEGGVDELIAGPRDILRTKFGALGKKEARAAKSIEKVLGEFTAFLGTNASRIPPGISALINTFCSVVHVHLLSQVVDEHSAAADFLQNNPDMRESSKLVEMLLASLSASRDHSSSSPDADSSASSPANDERGAANQLVSSIQRHRLAKLLLFDLWILPMFSNAVRYGFLSPYTTPHLLSNIDAFVHYVKTLVHGQLLGLDPQVRGAAVTLVAGICSPPHLGGVACSSTVSVVCPCTTGGLSSQNVNVSAALDDLLAAAAAQPGNQHNSRSSAGDLERSRSTTSISSATTTYQTVNNAAAQRSAAAAVNYAADVMQHVPTRQYVGPILAGVYNASTGYVVNCQAFFDAYERAIAALPSVVQPPRRPSNSSQGGRRASSAHRMSVGSAMSNASGRGAFATLMLPGRSRSKGGDEMDSPTPAKRSTKQVRIMEGGPPVESGEVAGQPQPPAPPGEPHHVTAAAAPRPPSSPSGAGGAANADTASGVVAAVVSVPRWSASALSPTWHRLNITIGLAKDPARQPQRSNDMPFSARLHTAIDLFVQRNASHAEENRILAEHSAPDEAVSTMIDALFQDISSSRIHPVVLNAAVAAQNSPGRRDNNSSSADRRQQQESFHASSLYLRYLKETLHHPYFVTAALDNIFGNNKALFAALMSGDGSDRRSSASSSSSQLSPRSSVRRAVARQRGSIDLTPLLSAIGLGPDGAVDLRALRSAFKPGQTPGSLLFQRRVSGASRGSLFSSRGFSFAVSDEEEQGSDASPSKALLMNRKSLVLPAMLQRTRGSRAARDSVFSMSTTGDATTPRPRKSLVVGFSETWDDDDGIDGPNQLVPTLPPTPKRSSPSAAQFKKSGSVFAVAVAATTMLRAPASQQQKREQFNSSSKSIGSVSNSSSVFDAAGSARFHEWYESLTDAMCTRVLGVVRECGGETEAQWTRNCASYISHVVTAETAAATTRKKRKKGTKQADGAAASTNVNRGPATVPVKASPSGSPTTAAPQAMLPTRPARAAVRFEEPPTGGHSSGESDGSENEHEFKRRRVRRQSMAVSLALPEESKRGARSLFEANYEEISQRWSDSIRGK